MFTFETGGKRIPVIRKVAAKVISTVSELLNKLYLPFPQTIKFFAR